MNLIYYNEPRGWGFIYYITHDINLRHRLWDKWAKGINEPIVSIASKKCELTSLKDISWCAAINGVRVRYAEKLSKNKD